MIINNAMLGYVDKKIFPKYEIFNYEEIAEFGIQIAFSQR